MELHPVASVNIRAIGYDHDSQRLVVQFHSGRQVHGDFLRPGGPGEI